MHRHEEWLRLAKEDLAVAKALLKLEFFATVTYHCQQSAEKALKAYIVLKNQPILKTHDLEKLLEICLNFDKKFIKLISAANFLNPYATKFRYPTEYDIPDQAEAELAIKRTQSIMRFVLKKISEPETGQTEIFETKKIIES